MSFSAKFQLTLEWFDDKITWNDLNNDKFLNIPSQDVVDKLWIRNQELRLKKGEITHFHRKSIWKK